MHYQQPFMAVLEDICVQLFMTIALTIDPKQIIVAGPRLSSLSLSHIKEKIQTYLSLRYQLDIDISQDLISDGLNGLHYMGMLRLFDIYTNYEKQTWKWIKKSSSLILMGRCVSRKQIPSPSKRIRVFSNSKKKDMYCF